MFLALTPHPQFWEFHNNSITLLGNWCITDKTKDIFKDKKYNIVSSPWKDKKTYEAVPYCFELMRFWMPYISNILNEVHGVNRTERYWRVLLSCWLYDYISIIYDKYLRVEKAIEELGKFETYILDENNYLPLMNLEHQFLILNNDAFNLQFFSIIIKEMKIPAKQVSLPESEFEYSNSLNTYPPYKLKLKSLLMRKIAKILQNMNLFLKKEVILEGISFKEKFILSQTSGQDLLYSIPKNNFKTEMLKFLDSDSTKLDRNVFEKLPIRNNFENIVKYAIKIGFPSFYFEKYRKILKIINPDIDKRKKMVIAITNWYTDEPFKFIAADIVDRGGRLIGMQQGGAFGATINMASELVERYITDIFISSGWMEKKDTEKEICEVIPLPIPKYHKMKNSHTYKPEKCIFVGNMIPRYVYRIQTFLIPEEMEEYFRWKYIFFKGLRSDILKNFYYRPFFYDYGWNEIELIKEKFPEMDILTGGNLVEEMKKCKLVVSDHLASSYLESLIINVPTVLFWDKEIFKIRPSADRYFDLLTDAKILHYDPVSAAEYVNEVFDDINEWWVSKSVQNARLEFINYIGLSSSDWAKKWSNFISN